VLEVELVTRRGCHLCDTALAMLERASEDVPLRVVLRDVDADDELRARYDWRVPVVLAAGREVAEGVITPLALRDALRAAAAREGAGPPETG
jgi:hypothetical protein